MAPPSGFDLAVIDPPWHFKAGMNARHAGSKYALMGLDAIKAMPIRAIMARDSWVILWHTEPMARQAFEVLDAWGARYSTRGVWVKRTRRGLLGFGSGFVLRGAHEPFIVAKFGRPKVVARNVRSVIEGPLREHSRKPDEAYAEFGRMVPKGADKIEVFSRETRAGWWSFGDEAGKFDAPGLSRPTGGS